MEAIDRDLAETKRYLLATVEQLIQRGDKLENLSARSNELSAASAEIQRKMASRMPLVRRRWFPLVATCVLLLLIFAGCYLLSAGPG